MIFGCMFLLFFVVVDFFIERVLGIEGAWTVRHVVVLRRMLYEIFCVIWIECFDFRLCNDLTGL